MNGNHFATEGHAFICPHCGQRISMLLDLSAGGQTYVEDCEVCCSPIEVSYRVEEGSVVFFHVRAC